MSLAKGSNQLDKKTEVEQRYVACLCGSINAAATDGKFERNIQIPFKPDEFIIRQAAIDWQNLGGYYQIVCPQLTTSNALCIVGDDNKNQPAQMEIYHMCRGEVRGLYTFNFLDENNAAVPSGGTTLSYFLVMEFIRHAR